jgi:hypothetical protein
VSAGVGVRKPVLLTLIRTAYDNMMIIQVTEEPRTEKKFCIYRGVLCFHSDFFNRALNGAFREGGAYFHEVKDCTIEIFPIFYDWVNTGVQDKTLSGGQAIDLFVFADYYAIPALKNVALDGYLQHFIEKWQWSAQDLRSAYVKTAENSPLRKLASDTIVDTIEFDDTTRNILSGINLPEECFLDMLRGFHHHACCEGTEARRNLKVLRKTGWVNTMRADFCERYHDHHEAEYHSVHA